MTDRLTDAMVLVLREQRDGCLYAFGQTRMGGRHKTFMSLVRRGLITGEGDITEAGRAALNQHDCPDAGEGGSHG